MAEQIYTNSIKVVVTTKGATTATFDDSVNAGSGASALAALEQGAAIDAKGETDRTIIPYCAVDNAVVTITRSQTDKPKDDICGGDV